MHACNWLCSELPAILFCFELSWVESSLWSIKKNYYYYILFFQLFSHKNITATNVHVLCMQGTSYLFIFSAFVSSGKPQTPSAPIDPLQPKKPAFSLSHWRTHRPMHRQTHALIDTPCTQKMHAHQRWRFSRLDLHENCFPSSQDTQNFPCFQQKVIRLHKQ